MRRMVERTKERHGLLCLWFWFKKFLNYQDDMAIFFHAGVLGASFLCANIAIAQTSLSSELYNFREDWSESWSEINLSMYVYFDLNRNGIYDLGDRALSDILVAVGKDALPVAVASSNYNGFANFATSLVKEDVVLSEVGDYEFVVIPPPGWMITSANGSQKRELVEKPGSVSGLGMERMLEPVGLAQYIFVRGAFAGDLPAQVKLLQYGKEVASTTVNPDGQFLIPASQGDFELVIQGQSQLVIVDAYPLDIGQFRAGTSTVMSSGRIDFEDMAPRGLQKVPNGYAGLGWFNLNAMSTAMGNDSVGYHNGATSGGVILYTSSGHPGEISRDIPFDFIGANLSVAWPEAEGEQVTIDFYRAGEKIATDVIGLSAYGPVSYRPMISGVTKVVFTPQHYWQVVIDDISVSLD